MDADLHSFDGLRINAFARKWKVSAKTVGRDLEAFKELGQKVCKEVDPERRTVWHYAVGVEWLFLANVPPKLRTAMKEAAKARR